MGTTNWDLFYISTHSLTRRLTLYPVLIIPHKDYFNSQPHKEADLPRLVLLPGTDISTHSLTRRLTTILQLIPNVLDISTHSLTRRLTGLLPTPKHILDISTHSLTRRLTAILDKNIFIQN